LVVEREVTRRINGTDGKGMQARCQKNVSEAQFGARYGTRDADDEYPSRPPVFE
jgi:hypothetical protein